MSVGMPSPSTLQRSMGSYRSEATLYRLLNDKTLSSSCYSSTPSDLLRDIHSEEGHNPAAFPRRQGYIAYEMYGV